MNEALYEYLSDEYMKCVSRFDELMQLKYQLQSKQRKYEENLYFHTEDESKRQMFSPLILKNEYSIHEVSQEQFQLSENGQELSNCLKEIKDVEKKKNQLKGFIHDLTQQSMQFDEFQEKEADEMPFFPAFYELVEHTTKQFQDVSFLYEKQEQNSKCLMTFGFLTTWKNLFSYIKDALLLSQVSVRVLNDKDKLMISMNFRSRVPIGKNVTKRIEAMLSKEYYLQSWNREGFEIQIILK